jgi:hypothetical protein
MFKVAKKPKKPRVVVSRDDDEDLDEQDAPVVVRPVKKAKKRTIVRSFEVDETEEMEKKKRKRKGPGFGGSLQVPNDENEEEASIEVTEAASIYDKGAIDKLRAEQKYRKMEEVPDDENDQRKDPITDKIVPSAQPLPAFIPLTDSRGKTMILTGDEALKYDEDYEDDDDGTSRNKVREELKETMQEDTPQEWEDEITRRAGVHAFQKKSTAFETTSISKLKEQVQATLLHLRNQQEDLHQAFNRRQVEVNQTKEEFERQDAEVKSAGTALEYYQELRMELSSWVGALRDLKNKVSPLQDALRLVDKEFSDRWVGLEDDTVNVLRENGLLSQVLGRQPGIPQEAATVVDEFGRDMKPQHIMAREKRARQKVRNERLINGDESDALIAENEKNELLERRMALREALKVAMNELDDHYASITNLIVVFVKWSTSYREDYKQCYAGMSLADLSSILVQVDLCSSHHPLHWISDGFSWINSFQEISALDDKIEEKPLYRMIDKVLIPVVEDILQEQAYSVISRQQTRSLSTFFDQVSKLLPKGNILIAKLSSRLVQYIHGSLRGMAIPLMKPGMPTNATDDVREAVTYATKGQLLRIERIVSNLLTYWAPPLGDKLAEPILDFLSSQFLFLLSSFEERKASAEAFGRVWTCLQTTNWLGRPEFMLQTALIRAAATAFL